MRVAFKAADGSRTLAMQLTRLHGCHPTSPWAWQTGWLSPTAAQGLAQGIRTMQGLTIGIDLGDRPSHEPDNARAKPGQEGCRFQDVCGPCAQFRRQEPAGHHRDNTEAVSLPCDGQMGAHRVTLMTNHFCMGNDGCAEENGLAQPAFLTVAGRICMVAWPTS